VRAFAEDSVDGAKNDKEMAVGLFLAVRDGIRYDPYTWDTDPEIFRASRTLETRRSFCIPKAILLAATARAIGIPSRLGFADVRNHLTTRRLRSLMRTDVFVFHGYTELFLGGRWLKATPTFNVGLCEKFGVQPLDFDGETDAVLHPFDREGRKHMEYLRDHGTFEDLPLEELNRVMRKAYPFLFVDDGLHTRPAQAGGDFEAEAAREPLV
jgi:transglutaminase-like putative cysteine protease